MSETKTYEEMQMMVDKLTTAAIAGKATIAQVSEAIENFEIYKSTHTVDDCISMMKKKEVCYV